MRDGAEDKRTVRYAVRIAKRPTFSSVGFALNSAGSTYTPLVFILILLASFEDIYGEA